nr:protein timeless homolog isoform X1 [Coffea arabica]
MEGLSTICAGIGILEEDDHGNRIGYSKSQYCLDNLKDLLRFMRRDDPQTREVFKQVCKWNTVGKDLIPIIEYCQDDRNLVLNAVKVLVFLTMPIDPTSDDIPQQIEYLWGVKSSVTFSQIVPVILSLLEKPLENLESEMFMEDDWKLVQLVLTLFRNLLAIQEISTQQKAGGSATQFLSLRDRFLELLFQENMMEIILVLSQHVGGSCGYLRQDNLLLLETFYYIFMGQEPELIAKAYLENSKEDENVESSLKGLSCIMQAEEEKRKLNKLRNLGCYSQFSGTFTRLTMDGSKTLFKGNPCSASHDALLKAHKNHRGPSKRTVWDHGKLPSTKTKILQLLHDFIDQFLSGGYNVLMQSIREDIDKECHAIQNNDVVTFFQVAWFVTSFQYHKFLNSKPCVQVDGKSSIDQNADKTLFGGTMCGPIAESLNESMFLVLISKWRFAFDGLKETNDYKMLSAAGSLLKIMIRILDLVLKQSLEDSTEPKTARILLYKLFYDQTEEGMTQFLLNMIKLFDTHKQAKSDFADLVETLYVIIRLLENLQTHSTLRVSKRSRKRKVKKDLFNESVGKDVTAQNEVIGPSYEQSEAVGILGKEKAVVHDSVGTTNEDLSQVSPHTEFEAEIVNSKSKPEVEQNVCHETYQGIDDSSGDEQPVTDEVDFNISTVVSALSNQTIIKNLCWLLKFYKSNSLGTNHYIISLLRRVCEDLELSPMLYQLSLLTTFYDILEEQKSKPCKEHENIVLFLTNLVRRMLRKMKTRPLLFVEVLFWKTRGECHLINAECMLKVVGNLRKEIRKGGLNEETGLPYGQGWVRRSIADALGDDEADIRTFHEEVGEKSKRRYADGKESIVSFSNDEASEKEHDSRDGHSFEKVSKGLQRRRKPLVLNDELEGKFRDLYEKYKNHENCYHLIANALDEYGARISPIQVPRTLKKLGLQLLRKRRMSVASSADELRDGEITHLSGDGSSSLRKPLHTRKRVRALSEDQEQRIKELYEQFKDHKRCNYMIANALDTEGSVSTAQVSRKLKQLGLFVPRKKRSDTNFHLRDDDSSELSAGSADDSDNATLMSLKRRSKSETKYASRQNQESARQPSLDNSDDEMLRSFLPKSQQTKIEITERQNQENGGKLDISGHDELLRDATEKLAEVRTLDMGSGTSEHAGFTETEGLWGVNQSVSALTNEANNRQPQKLHDELADFEGEVSPVESQKSIVSRRHLRMIMDLDDDE